MTAQEEAAVLTAKLAVALGALDEAAKVLRQVSCKGGGLEGPLHCIGCLASATADKIGEALAEITPAAERLLAIEEAARGLVRNVKDSLDIVASSYYDDIKRLVEGEV